LVRRNSHANRGRAEAANHALMVPKLPAELHGKGDCTEFYFQFGENACFAIFFTKDATTTHIHTFTLIHLRSTTDTVFLV
jgi:hypothetical protein